jgi:hypothetical protein
MQFAPSVLPSAKHEVSPQPTKNKKNPPLFRGMGVSFILAGPMGFEPTIT